ncbi:hypothetical protein [Actinocorallia sp. A-T 12471]|uniref:hypothetical protein n=1 Tax=Actinocorallia sp. A-T 12471 TaxID=3089813 RepID=UPI0029D0035C|nr:hypothetical protein [Actinocorallia sp. A-T 12471]MDX6741325.1 hypothetical protein [Actinocorallia sp. A-T 12471]
MEISGNVDAYANRVRSALVAGVGLAGSGAFVADELPMSGIPDWLSRTNSLSGEQSGRPFDAAEGVRRYIEHREEDAWPLDEWLWGFEPGVRQWSWWDLTAAGANVVQIWVDSRSEPVFQCEDIRWIAYLAGARAVVGPILLPSQVWIGQTTLGA